MLDRTSANYVGVTNRKELGQNLAEKPGMKNFNAINVLHRILYPFPTILADFNC